MVARLKKRRKQRDNKHVNVPLVFIYLLRSIFVTILIDIQIFSILLRPGGRGEGGGAKTAIEPNNTNFSGTRSGLSLGEQKLKSYCIN